MPEHKIDFDEKGNVVLKNKINVARGEKSKRGGLQFEARVRRDLEEKNWVVDKWSNNIDLEADKIIIAKKSWKFNPFKKAMMPAAQGTGFPDFVAFQKMDNYYKIVGVEVKSNGKLNKIEKLKCKWYLDKKIFNEVWIAKKGKDGRKIVIDYIKLEN